MPGETLSSFVEVNEHVSMNDCFRKGKVMAKGKLSMNYKVDMNGEVFVIWGGVEALENHIDNGHILLLLY